MLPFLSTDRRDAIPITPVTASTLSAWIERHPAVAELKAAVDRLGCPEFGVFQARLFARRPTG